MHSVESLKMAHDPFNDFLIRHAHQVVTDNPAGLFITNGSGNFPTARWCVGTATPNLTKLYFLTRASTRKLNELQVHPECTWVFSSPDHEDVVSISGIAHALDSFLAVDADWDKLLAILQRYEAGPARSNMSFQSMVGIEVIAKRAEILSPRMKINTPTHIALALQRDDATIDG
jgi:general stress protein 26